MKLTKGRARAAAGCVILLLLNSAVPGASAAERAWNGGSGFWTTGSVTNWADGLVWGATNPLDSAVFGGIAGAVTLTNPVAVDDITLGTDGYSFTSASPSNT